MNHYNQMKIKWSECPLINRFHLIIFSVDVSPYKELLDSNRWTALIEDFRQDYFRLYQLAPLSVLAVALQAGLSAMKTP